MLKLVVRSVASAPGAAWEIVGLGPWTWRTPWPRGRSIGAGEKKSGHKLKPFSAASNEHGGKIPVRVAGNVSGGQ